MSYAKITLLLGSTFVLPCTRKKPKRAAFITTNSLIGDIAMVIYMLSLLLVGRTPPLPIAPYHEYMYWPSMINSRNRRRTEIGVVQSDQSGYLNQAAQKFEPSFLELVFFN